jgi:hypothetical protein
MTETKLPRYFIKGRNDQVNGHVHLSDGHCCIALPNYTEIHKDPPTITGGEFIYCIEPRPGQVKAQVESGKEVVRLWVGPQESRFLPQELVTVILRPRG